MSQFTVSHTSGQAAVACKSCKLSDWAPAPLHPAPATHTERGHVVSMGQPCQVWISERLIPYLGTLEPCVDMHRTVSYIAWSYWGQERSGGTEALQMFFISGPQGKAVTTTPGSFCSGLGGRAVMLCLPQSGYLTEKIQPTPLLCHITSFMETLATIWMVDGQWIHCTDVNIYSGLEVIYIFYSVCLHLGLLPYLQLS